MTQVHDFNPGITPNGVFWIVPIPDDAVQIRDDGETMTIHLVNVPVVDQGSFPAGTGTTPALVSFDVTYQKFGSPRLVRPATTDPLSPFAWAGEMWMATNSGTFSVAYADSSFSATGSFSSNFLPAGNFGELGTERNGSYVEREDIEKDVAGIMEGDQAPKAQKGAAAAAGDPANSREYTVMALKASRAKALGARKSNP